MTSGPAPPVPPAVVARDAAGHVTVRAVRVDSPIHIDGKLDESVYRATEAVSDFLQQEPDEGEPATERTEAWVFFDDDNIYVSARCWDTHPERMVANEMRRDTSATAAERHFRRAVRHVPRSPQRVLFYANPIGGLADSQITDEGAPNVDWNTVWDVKTGRFDGGWTDRDGDPVQVAALRPGTRADLGHQLAARRALEERVVVPHADSARAHHVPRASSRCRRRRRWSASRRRRPARTSSSSRTRSPSVTTDNTSRRRVDNDLDGRAGRRREVRHHAEHHGRLHRTTPTSRRSRSTSSR